MQISCNTIHDIEWKKFLSYDLKGNAHIIAAEVPSGEEEILYLKSFLSEGEIKRTSRFAFIEHANRYAAAHGFLRLLLSKYLKVSPQEIELSEAPGQKPAIRIPVSSLKFNISHSEEKILIAINESDEIGVDIEKVKKDFNIQEIIQSKFSKEEQRQINNAQNKTELFYKFWTRKEAVLKTSGEGIADQLEKINVSDDQTIEFLPDLYVYSFPVSSNFIASVSLEKNKPLIFFKVKVNGS